MPSDAPRSTEADVSPARQFLPYRTAFETKLDFREGCDRVREQLRAWLGSKHLDVERFDEGATSIGPGVALLYAATNSAAGWQLRERVGTAVTWVSTISVTRSTDDGPTWVSVNVEAISAQDAALPPAAPPRLVGLLLESIDAYDGEAQLRAHPAVVTAAGVEELLVLVCEPERRLPVVVATTPTDIAFEAWRMTVNQVTKELSGLASTFVLDPAATVQFNAGMGSTHWIGPGAIRTYLPGADPAVTEDAVRHRVLGRRRIEAEPRRAMRILSAPGPRQDSGMSVLIT
jgi:hypothetical protein